MEHHYYVYMMMSSSRRALYIGVTGHLGRRVWQHKHAMFEGFSAKYRTDRLVWFERYQYVKNAIAREKQLKNWRRNKKLALIARANPAFRDLAAEWYETQGPSAQAFALARNDKL